MKAPSKPKDRTAAKRSAALKKRLLEDGGKRLPINLSGDHVRKIQRLIAAGGHGADIASVIRTLIDQAPDL